MARFGLFAAIFIFTPAWNLSAQTLKEQAQEALATQCIATTADNPPAPAPQAKDCLDALHLYIVSRANADLALKRLSQDQPSKDVQETYSLAASQFKDSFWEDLVAKATKMKYVTAKGGKAADADVPARPVLAPIGCRQDSSRIPRAER
jgi:hypothetical protein